MNDVEVGGGLDWVGSEFEVGHGFLGFVEFGCDGGFVRVCSDSVWSRIKVEGHVKGLLHV